MKIDLLPATAARRGDAVAKDIGVSRSRLLQAVVEDLLQRWRADIFAETIDRYVSKRGSGLNEDEEPWPRDSELARRAQRRDESKRTASRKTAASFPAGLLDKADAAAKNLGVSRNDLCALRCRIFLTRHNSSEKTRRLNKSYIKHPPEPDPVLDYLVLEGMKRMERED